MNDKPEPLFRLTGAMSLEERARVVVALDHDVRQPQHAIEMGLRNLRLLASEIEEAYGEVGGFGTLLERLRIELASVQAAARQVIDIQQDLIDAIRLEFDDTRPTPRTIRAHDLINRVVRTNRVLAANIELHATSTTLAFVADERWTERILNNLVSNAIFHSGADRILVGARRRGEEIQFEVRDNGHGMTPDKVERVFEPLKMPALGTAGYAAARSGLGLYNVRLFTKRMGGTVECSSRPNLGTLFRVRLPGPVQSLEDAKPHLAGRTRTRSRFVAILDDDENVLQATERFFSNLGVEVYSDSDPLRWLTTVTDLKRMPDLFLLDFQLGRQDCSLHLDIIRRKWRDQPPKVVVVTAHGEDPRLQRIASSVPVLRKPLSDPQFDLILDVLNGIKALPLNGFL